MSDKYLTLLHRRLSDDEHDFVVTSVFSCFPVLATRLASLQTSTPVITTWYEVCGDYWEEYLDSLAPFGKTAERVTARTPQHPVTISAITADQLSKIRPTRDDITVIPNSINSEQIGSPSLPDESNDILFASRLIEHKNVDLLLEAIDTFTEK